MILPNKNKKVFSSTSVILVKIFIERAVTFFNYYYKASGWYKLILYN